MLLLVLPAPPDPSINAHDGVIQVYTCLAYQSLFKTQVDVKYGIDETDRVNKDIFFPAKPYADDPGKNRDIFYWPGAFYAFQESF